MMGWGLFLGTARNYVQGSGEKPGAVLLYALTIAFIFRGIAGDSISILVGLPEQALSAALIGIWITNRRIISGVKKSLPVATTGIQNSLPI
jgi:hypothetical protein